MSTKIQVPSNVADPIVLKRFLNTIVEQLDLAFGYRGNTPFVSEADLVATQGNLTVINANLLAANAAALAALKQAEEELEALIADGDASTLSSANSYADTGDTTTLSSAHSYTDTNSTDNPEQAAIADLGQTTTTVSATYVQTEVQAIADDLKSAADKVDVVLAALRSANIIGV